MKTQARQFAVDQAVRRGWNIRANDDRVFAVKGFGLVVRMEIFVDGSAAVAGLEVGIAGKSRKRHDWAEPVDFSRNAA